MIKLNKHTTDKLARTAVDLVKAELSDLKTIDIVYNISKRTYEITMIYDRELVQNNRVVMLPLGIFIDVDEKKAINDAVDLMMNAHFNAMLKNPLLSL